MRASFVALVLLLCAAGTSVAQNDVHVASNADIGVGTDTPSDKIHVFESTLPYIRLSNDNTGLSTGLRLGINGSGDAWLYTMSARDMNLGTNGTGRIFIESTGDVGIGTINPYSKLTMNGTVGFLNSISPMLYMFESETDNADKTVIAHSPAFSTWGLGYKDLNDNFFIRPSASGATVWFNVTAANVGVEYEDPYNDLILSGIDAASMPILRIGHTGGFNEESSGAIIFEENIEDQTADNFCGVAMRLNGNTNDLEFRGACTGNMSTSTLIMAMDRGGSIGINTVPNSSYKLQIAGDVRAQEIVVETGWADYVFEDSYELASLGEVESFIETNKHLPGVPKGAEIEADGLKVGAISEVFMRKIEELTLYTIDQEKQIAEQEKAIQDLQEKINYQTELVNALLLQMQELQEQLASNPNSQTHK